ncbi:hypothetical protein [Viridibacillus arvi]|uniref:hypothetical protein n=1 Tax=Viridibacillus arvi TaxID=263475 RepID=UPI003D298DFC
MKKWKLAISILIGIILIFFISGYKFTSLSAAKANAFLPKDAEMIEEYNTGSSVVFLFKSDGEKLYQTVLSEKFGVLFQRSLSTSIPYSSDELQTVGGISFTTEKDAATILSVVSNDEKVAYIEAGVEPNIERKDIHKGERISFLFPFSEQIDFLNPTAFDKAGKALYYYGPPKNVNHVNIPEDIKWHKIID